MGVSMPMTRVLVAVASLSLIFVATSAVPVPSSITTQVCDNSKSDPTYAFNLTTGHITPDPPQKGKPIVYEFEGTVLKDITGGKITFNLLYQIAGKWVHGPFHKDYDICGQVTCPLKAGPVKFMLKSDIPAFVPKGSYKVELPVQDSNGLNVTCVDLLFDL